MPRPRPPAEILADHARAPASCRRGTAARVVEREPSLLEPSAYLVAVARRA